MLYEFLKPLAIFLFKLLFKIKVKGKKEVPSTGALILASNHLSYLDPIVLGVAFPRRLYFLAKEELFKNRLFALLIKSLGAIPLKRGATDIRAIKEALKILKEGKVLVIFPQGSRDKDFTQIKSGVGFLAKKAGCNVVAAKIKGTEVVLPKDKKKIKLANISVTFRFVSCKDDENYDSLSQKVFEVIKNLK